MPGWMTLERMPSFANWIARDLLSAMSAPFAAVYASWARVKPASADTEPIRMMEPPPAARKWGIPYLVTQKTDFRLMAMTRSHQVPSVSSTERSRSFQSTPALLYRTWSAPNRRTPSSIMRSTSDSTATSPIAATASPPVRVTSATVSAAAARSISATTMQAPSEANRIEASRPIPMPAPVISATLPASLGLISPPRSDPLEVPDQFPVGDGLVERLLLEATVMQVVLDHAGTERLARDLGPRELVERLAQRLRHLRERRVLVGVALVERRALELPGDAVEARRDRRGEREIRVRVGAGDAVLHPEAPSLAAQAEAARAIVPAAGDARRSEAACLVSLVGVDGGRVEVRELPRHGHLPRQPVLEQRAPLARAGSGEEILPAARIPYRRMQVEGGARRPHVVLRHERDRRALRPGDLLDPVLVEHVAVGHLERFRVPEIDLLLAPSPLALREFHRHAGRLHVVPDRADQAFLLRGLQDVVVLEVARDRREAVVPLRPCLVERLAEQVQLELGRGFHEQTPLLCALDLTPQHDARRLLDGLSVLGVNVAEHQGGPGQPRDHPPRRQVRDELHVAVAAFPRRELEPGQRLHLHVDGEEVDAGVEPLRQHVVEEIAADHALAHEPAEMIRTDRQHGIDVATADRHLEGLRIDFVAAHPRPPAPIEGNVDARIHRRARGARQS